MVLAAVEDPDDHNVGFSHLKDDRRPTFKSHSAETLANVVAFRTSLGKSLQSHAGRFNSIDIGTRGFIAGFFSDMAIKAKQIRFSTGTEGDPISSRPAGFSIVRRDGRATV